MSKNRVDFHHHTTKSDGFLTEYESAKYLIENGFTWFGHADHQYFHKSFLKEMGYRYDAMTLAYYELDASKFCNNDESAVNYVPSAELTVREDSVLNENDHPSKFHFIAMSPVLKRTHTMKDKFATSTDKSIKENNCLKVTNIKRQDDVDYIFAPIEYIYRLMDVQYPAKTVIDFYQTYTNNIVGKIKYTEGFFEMFPAEIEKLGYKNSEIFSAIRDVSIVAKDIINYLYEQKGVEFPKGLVKEYKRKCVYAPGSDRITEALARNFFKEYALSKNDEANVRKLGLTQKDIFKMIRNVPEAKRVNLPTDVAIKAVHDAGGLVLVAHPLKNLMVTKNPAAALYSLVLKGVDGFNFNECDPKNFPPTFKLTLIDDYINLKMCLKERELKNVQKLSGQKYEDELVNFKRSLYDLEHDLLSKDLNQIMIDICESAPHKNKLIYDAGGSDAHTVADYENMNMDKFTAAKCPVTLSELKELQKNRLMGYLSHRDYTPMKSAVNQLKWIYKNYSNQEYINGQTDYVNAFIEENTPQVEMVEEEFGGKIISYNRNTKYGKFADTTIAMQKKDKLVRDIKRKISEGKDYKNGLTVDGVYVSPDWVIAILVDNITTTEYRKIVNGEDYEIPQTPFKEDIKRPVTKQASRYFNNGRGGM